MADYEEFPKPSKSSLDWVEDQGKPPGRPSDPPDPGCPSFLNQCDPRNDPVEFLNTLALGIMVVGLVIVTVAFMIPRDYVFDPDMPAVEMEAIEQYYADLSARLDAVMAAGTVLIAVGGVIIGGIFTWMLLRGDFAVCFRNPEDDERELYEEQRGYGTGKGYGYVEMEEVTDTSLHDRTDLAQTLKDVGDK